MIPDRDLERVVRDWLDDGPAILDDRVVRTTMTSIRAGHPPRRGWPEPSPLTLVWLAATLLVVAAAATVVGAALRLGPSPVPTPDHAAVPPSVPGADPSMLAGTWSTLDVAPGLPPGRWTLSLGEWALVSRPHVDGDETPAYALWLRPVEAGPLEVRVRTRDGPCAEQLGVHRWSLVDDVLALEAESDPCAERRAALDARRWTREPLDAIVPGRRYGFDEFGVPFTARVPEGTSIVASQELHGDNAELREADTDRVLVFARSPRVFDDPCDTTSAPRAVSGAAALAAAVEALGDRPGVTVERRTSVIDERTAIELTVRIEPGATDDCADRILAFWVDRNGSGRALPGPTRSGHWSLGGTVDRFLFADVGNEVLAVAAQASAADASMWFDTVDAILADLRLLDRPGSP